MRSKILLSIGNTILFAAVIAVNALANALPINGMNTGEISALYPSMFTPSGITFSIWSVIYLSLFTFVIYQWKMNNRSFFPSLSKWFMVSCVLNITWIFVWHHLLSAVSVVVMLLFLLVLTRLFVLVHTIELQSRKEYFLIRLPFTLYLSWICVATIANIAAWLAGLNVIESVSTQTTLTVVMMLIASVLAIVIVLRFKDYAFPLVTIWALCGIALKRLEIITPAAVGIALALTGVLLFSVVRSRGITTS
jgi:translocator protein